MRGHDQGWDIESMGCPELGFISACMFEGIVQACSLLIFLRTEGACRSCPWIGETAGAAARPDDKFSRGGWGLVAAPALESWTRHSLRGDPGRPPFPGLGSRLCPAWSSETRQKTHWQRLGKPAWAKSGFLSTLTWSQK